MFVAANVIGRREFGMADDFLDKVFADSAPMEEAPPVQEKEAAVESMPETVAEPAPEPEKQPEAVEPQQNDRSGYVPIDAMLTEREKRQALERRVAEFEARQTPQARPDAFDDPEGYDRHLEQRIEERVARVRADTSYALAVRDYGKDTVEAARTWALERAQKDPVFNQQVGTVFATEMLPVDWVVQQHKRDALLSDIGDPSKLDDWFEREAVKRGFAKASAPAVAAPVVAASTPAPKPAVPPRSIASDSSPAASQTNANPMAAMDALFTR